MVEFRSITLNATEAKREGFSPTENLDININIDKVRPSGDQLALDFIYTVTYKPKSGYLRLYGSVFLADKPAELNKILSSWKKDRTLPKDLTQPLLNIINMTSGVNGVFIARALNLAPPLLPPKLELTKSGATSKR